MKKLLFILLSVCLGYIAMAQETEVSEYKMDIGDTLVWQAFEKPGNIGYDISGRSAIDFQPIGMGNKVQVIAKKEGKCLITAKYGEKNSQIMIIVKAPVMATPQAVKLEKPATQTFTGTYKFIPPADHFFVTIYNPEHDCRETFVKIGDEEAFNDGLSIDRFWNKKTGKNWYYRPESQGWTPDVDWEFEPFEDSFFPLNSFANEVQTDNLSQYYIGMEKVLDVNCWHFFVDLVDGTVIQYWVDPSNGCTLRRQVNNNKATEVTVYDLKYPRWFFGPKFKKSLHDTTR